MVCEKCFKTYRDDIPNCPYCGFRPPVYPNNQQDYFVGAVYASPDVMMGKSDGFGFSLADDEEKKN